MNHTGVTAVGGVEFQDIKIDFDFGDCMIIESSQ